MIINTTVLLPIKNIHPPNDLGGGGVAIETALYLAKKWSSNPEVVSFLMDHEALEREAALSLLRKAIR